MKNKLIPLAIAIIVLAACIGALQYASQDADQNIAADVFETAAEEETSLQAYTQAVEEAVSEDQADENPQASEEDTKESSATPSTTTPPRVENGFLTIGDTNAPITMIEFSSLTCSHCASHHNRTLGDIKKDYVDTGKLKIVFYDFPLNQPALHASLLLQCIDDGADRYELMEMLFDQQAQWAFGGDHATKLKQYASLLGIASDKADACMGNTEKEQDILKKMKVAATEHNINSTPSFVLMPSNTVITGAQPYGSFSSKIEELLKQ